MRSTDYSLRSVRSHYIKVGLTLSLSHAVTVRDARPDKYIVNVDENVTCSADGDPIPSEFHWVCDPFDEDKDGWKATGEVIVFTHAKEYACKCVASHLIYIRVHHAVWNGTIVVNPSRNDFKSYV